MQCYKFVSEGILPMASNEPSFMVSFDTKDNWEGLIRLHRINVSIVSIYNVQNIPQISTRLYRGPSNSSETVPSQERKQTI